MAHDDRRQPAVRRADTGQQVVVGRPVGADDLHGHVARKLRQERPIGRQHHVGGIGRVLDDGLTEPALAIGQQGTGRRMRSWAGSAAIDGKQPHRDRQAEQNAKRDVPFRCPARHGYSPAVWAAAFRVLTLVARIVCCSPVMLIEMTLPAGSLASELMVSAFEAPGFSSKA